MLASMRPAQPPKAVLWCREHGTHGWRENRMNMTLHQSFRSLAVGRRDNTSGFHKSLSDDFSAEKHRNIKTNKERVKTEAVSHHLENDDLFLSALEVKFFPFCSTRLRLENSMSINRKLKLPPLQAISCQGIHTVFNFPSWK